MAFGFPASHVELIPLNNLSKLQFTQIVIYISKKIDWSIITIDADELIAVTKNNKNTWNETISISFEEDTVLLRSTSNGNQIHDYGRNKKNTEAFLNILYEIVKDFPSLHINEDLTIEDLKQETEIFLTQKETHSNTIAQISAFYSFFSIFIPVKDYFITPVLINLNILLFLVMSFSGVHFINPKNQDIIDWGANYGAFTTDGEWWRLLSASFVHIGFIDLAINCIALAYVGLLLESYLKKWGFLITYFLCGIIANLSSLYWNKDAVSAGSSGAIFGMFGILLTILLFKVLRTKINIKQIILTFISIFISACYTFVDGLNRTDYLGGLVIGIIFGIIFLFFRQKRKRGLILIASGASILIICLFINYKNTQVYIYQTMEYEERMQEFADMEKMALEAYNTQYGSTFQESKEMALYMIKDRGIYYWNENISLLTELDKLYLPHTLHKRNKDMIKYCKLRISIYELACKKISENSSEYDAEMVEINDEITALLNKLNQPNTDS
jgi:rhomboid protease GluP